MDKSELLKLTIENASQLMLQSIPIGVLIGSFFHICGLAVSGIVKIFKKT